MKFGLPVLCIAFAFLIGIISDNESLALLAGLLPIAFFVGYLYDNFNKYENETKKEDKDGERND